MIDCFPPLRMCVVWPGPWNIRQSGDVKDFGIENKSMAISVLLLQLQWTVVVRNSTCLSVSSIEWVLALCCCTNLSLFPLCFACPLFYSAHLFSIPLNIQGHKPLHFMCTNWEKSNQKILLVIIRNKHSQSTKYK